MDLRAGMVKAFPPEFPMVSSRRKNLRGDTVPIGEFERVVAPSPNKVVRLCKQNATFGNEATFPRGYRPTHKFGLGTSTPWVLIVPARKFALKLNELFEGLPVFDPRLQQTVPA